MKKINSALNERLGAYIVEYAMCNADVVMGTQPQAIYDNSDAYPYFRHMCDTAIRMAMGDKPVFAHDIMCDTIGMSEDVELEAIHEHTPEVYKCLLAYASTAVQFVYDRVIDNIRVRYK